MTRRGIATLLAVVAVVVFAVIVVASSLNSGDSPSHTMPGGGTMQGEQMTTPAP